MNSIWCDARCGLCCELVVYTYYMVWCLDCAVAIVWIVNDVRGGYTRLLLLLLLLLLLFSHNQVRGDTVHEHGACRDTAITPILDKVLLFFSLQSVQQAVSPSSCMRSSSRYCRSNSTNKLLHSS